MTDAEEFDAFYGEPMRKHWLPHRNERNPERRLRIGYVSPDIRVHPVTLFLEPLMANHDAGQFEVHVYAHLEVEDKVTERFKDYAHGWTRTNGMSDDVLATDPASGYDPGSWLLFNNVFQSLLSFPKGGTEPEPDAAKECSFTDTKTQVYTCTLKDGLKFSNGDALTSEDVKFSFDLLL